MTTRISRKAIAQLVAVSTLAVSLTACSNDAKTDNKADDAAKATTTVATATTSETTTTTVKADSEANAKDVTVATMIGDKAVEETFPVAPKKVMAMGQTAIDNLLTIGVTPDVIVVSERELNIPWQSGKLDKAQVIKVASFKDFKAEEMAAAKPDLIVGDQWRVSDKTFDKLKAIAPTLGAVKTADMQGWEAQVTALGKIYNKSDAAEAAIKEHKDLFAKAQKDMPGLKGKTGVISQFIGDKKAFGVVADPNIPGTSFLKDLGMTIPADIVAKASEGQGGRITVSAENVSMLAADFMVIGPRGGTIDDIKAVPGFDALPQVKSGATKFAEKPYLLQALNQPSALSLAYALENFTPELKKAAGE